MAVIKPVMQKIGFEVFLDSSEYATIQGLLSNALHEAEKRVELKDVETCYGEACKIEELKSLVRLFDSEWIDD